MNGCPTVSEVRRALASAAATSLEPEGWTQSVFVPGLPGPGPRDPREAAHRSWSIAAVSTEPVAQDRQRPRSRAVVARTTFTVTWSWGITIDDQVASYDAALDGEERLIAAVLAIDELAFPARLVRATRRASAAWVVGEIQIVVDHPLNLGLAEVT